MDFVWRLGKKDWMSCSFCLTNIAEKLLLTFDVRIRKFSHVSFNGINLSDSFWVFILSVKSVTFNGEIL